MTDIPEDAPREIMVAAVIENIGPVVGTPEYLARPGNKERLEQRRQSAAASHVDAALSALRAAGYEVRRSDHIAALESLATGAADILPLVSEWFHASEAERAAEGIDWECRAHMGVLAVMHEAQALAPPAPSE